MTDLPAPMCVDCVSFMRERRDEQGRAVGRCRFRPELQVIREDFPLCGQFHVRPDRVDHVAVPRSAGRRAGGSRRSAAPREPVRRRPTLRDPTSGDVTGDINMDRDGLKQVLRELLEEETLFGYPEMGRRWEGGTLVIKPADPELQPKEVPLETFFSKVVMVRDRLRVLEAKINGNDKLSAQDKVDLESYISKCYGTLTTFNALFANKSDQFSSKS